MCLANRQCGSSLGNRMLCLHTPKAINTTNKRITKYAMFFIIFPIIITKGPRYLLAESISNTLRYLPNKSFHIYYYYYYYYYYLGVAPAGSTQRYYISGGSEAEERQEITEK